MQNKKPILVALTGSICSGKSFLSSILSDLGIIIFSWDESINKITKQPEVIKQIQKIFPSAIKDSKIDKTALRQIVFNDKQKLLQLEKILHPLAQKAQDEFVNSHKDTPHAIIIAIEIPLLFEKGLEKFYDYVIVAYTSLEIMKTRFKRRALDEDIFSKILNAQLPDEEKISKADFVIETDKERKVLALELKKIIEEIHERNNP